MGLQINIKTFSGNDDVLCVKKSLPFTDGHYSIPVIIYTEHPAGRALTSEWFINSFVMVVREKFF